MKPPRKSKSNPKAKKTLTKEQKKLAKGVEDQSRQDYLDDLIANFERDQTIQDVGTWLLNDTMDQLWCAAERERGRHR